MGKGIRGCKNLNDKPGGARNFTKQVEKTNWTTVVHREVTKALKRQKRAQLQQQEHRALVVERELKLSWKRSNKQALRQERKRRLNNIRAQREDNKKGDLGFEGIVEDVRDEEAWQEDGDWEVIGSLEDGGHYENAAMMKGDPTDKVGTGGVHENAAMTNGDPDDRAEALAGTRNIWSRMMRANAMEGGNAETE